jgi:dTMP kinase
MQGKFIVIEGGDGSGKTTMVRLAQEMFPDVVVTREPGGAPFAEMIRQVILCNDAKDADANTQFGLFWASRADHMRNKVIPTVMAGKHIVTDRFDSSSYAYQIHGQQNVHLKELFFAVRKVYLNDFVPHMYIFLDVDPKEGFRRRASEKGYDTNHFDERALDFHERIREGYLEFLQHVPHKIVDANKPLEDVKRSFIDTLKSVIA